jgi:hypothetical protein
MGQRGKAITYYATVINKKEVTYMIQESVKIWVRFWIVGDFEEGKENVVKKFLEVFHQVVGFVDIAAKEHCKDCGQ